MQHTFLSPYRIMWLFIMFDLPVATSKERKQATGFRKDLLDLGCEMSQFSIYLKYCASGERAESLEKQIEGILPDAGKIDILKITDKQFANMKRFYGETQIKNTGKPGQLNLF